MITKSEKVLRLLEQSGNGSGAGGHTTGSKGASKAGNGQSGTNGSTSSEESGGEEENSSNNGDGKTNDNGNHKSRHSFHYAYGVRCNCDDPHGRKCLLYCRTRINRK